MKTPPYLQLQAVGSHRHGMEASLIAEFIGHTGSDAQVAKDILEGQKWDMKSALQVYYFLSQHDLLSKTTNIHDEAKEVTEKRSSAGSVHLPPGRDKEDSEEDTVDASAFPRAPLKKLDALEIPDYDYKKLSRGISRATENVNLVSKARNKLAQDFTDSEICHISQYFIDTPIFTFTLPDLNVYPDNFRIFMEKDLIELSTLVSLEQSVRLNWWADIGACQRLWPLATTGDGNCLLHAASLGMWGFHDRLLTLRKALHAFLSQSKHTPALYRRWRWQQTLQNAQAGFAYNECEWHQEWEIIVRMASTEPRTQVGRRRSSVYENLVGGSSIDKPMEGATYESLEEIHILALCHVLRRPIIVVADTVLKDVNGEALAPIPFGGIYLPLEIPPSECHRSPLVLTFDAAHFSALVAMEKIVTPFEKNVIILPAMIPVTDSEHKLLSLQFNVDPGDEFAWQQEDLCDQVIQKLTLMERDKLGVLKEYLDLVKVAIPLAYMEDNNNWEEVHMGTDSPCDASPIHVLFSTPSEFDNADGRQSSQLQVEEPFFNLADTGIFSGKSKSSKQLQSVARQFGSIGKSVSKKIKNFVGRSNSFKKKDRPTNDSMGSNKSIGNNVHLVSKSQDYILGATIHTNNRHEFHEEMIRNYLQSAKERFEKELESKQMDRREAIVKSSDNIVKREYQQLATSVCVSPGCAMYGTAANNYMCSSCYSKQKDQDCVVINGCLPTSKYSHNEAMYGTGRSRFYAESDTGAHANLSKVPSTKAGSNNDQTLYLSKSTFYNDASLSGANSGATANIQSYNLAKDENKKSAPYRKANADNKSMLANKPSSKTLDVTKGKDEFDSQSRNNTVSTLTSQFNSSELPGVSVNDMAKMTAPPAENRNTNLTSSGLNMPCRTHNCQFYGSPDTAYFCSKCYKESSSGIHVNVHVQPVRTSQV